MILKKLGAAIRRRRQQRKQTLAQLAKAAGISTGYLAHIELGRYSPGLGVLAGIAAALGAKVHHLIGDFEPISVDQLVDDLFTSGSGEVAHRLVLTSRDGKDLGAYIRDAIKTRLERFLKEGT